MLTGKNLIGGGPVDAADETFTARGMLAHFQEASSVHILRQIEHVAFGAVDKQLPRSLADGKLSRSARPEAEEQRALDRGSPPLEQRQQVDAFGPRR